MTRRSLWSAILIPLFAAACGPGQVVVTTEVEAIDAETGEPVMQPIDGMQVQLVPFDRDAIFDSLAAAADEPEPELSADLLQARDSIQEVQQIYRDADARVVALREQMSDLNDEMAQYSQAEPRYAELFNEFNQLEAELNQQIAVRDEYFELFTELQSETIEQLDQARVRMELWEEQAFADYGEVAAQRMDEAGNEILTDTTDAQGRVSFRPPPGEWWVHARHRLPTEELYWNVRVDVERGDPLEILLHRENAELRPVF